MREILNFLNFGKKKQKKNEIGIEVSKNFNSGNLKRVIRHEKVFMYCDKTTLICV